MPRSSHDRAPPLRDDLTLARLSACPSPVDDGGSNDGGGDAAEVVKVRDPAGSAFDRLRVCNADGDAFPDLAGIDSDTGRLAIHLGFDGGLGPHRAWTYAGRLSAFAVGDVTEDSRPDLVLARTDQHDILVSPGQPKTPLIPVTSEPASS